MSAAMIEFEVLAAAPDDDARAAIERLATLGQVILLVGEKGTTGADAYAAAGNVDLTVTSWSGAGGSRPHGAGPGSRDARNLDRAAVAQLQEIRAAHHAGWLIAAETTLATARACPGLRVICIGPAADHQDPTRPDHRAHSLLDAARFIETSETFA
jgi:hypothetical protein